MADVQIFLFAFWMFKQLVCLLEPAVTETAAVQEIKLKRAVRLNHAEIKSRLVRI